MRRPARPGKQACRCSAVAATVAGSSSARPRRRAPDRDPAAAPAEGDAPVRGGAEVIDQRAAVGDALAAGPTDLLQQVGDRLGEDDVRGGDAEAVAQGAAPGLDGGADRQHRRAAPAPQPPGVQASTPAGPSRSARTGVDSKSSTPRRAQALAQAQDQARRLHRRRVRVEGAGTEGRRGAAGRDLVRVQRPHRIGRAQLLDRPPAPAPRRRRGPRRSRPGGSRRDGTRRRPPRSRRTRQSRRRRRSAARATASAASSPQRLRMRRQREPHHVAEAAVASTRAASAGVRLEHDDPSVRLQPLHVPGRPEAGEATADNDHVGVAVAVQRQAPARPLPPPPASSPCRVCFIAPVSVADRRGGRRRLGSDARFRSGLDSLRRCSARLLGARPRPLPGPGPQGRRRCRPGDARADRHGRAAQRHPLGHRGRRHRPRTDAVPAGAAARRRGLGRAPLLVPRQRRLAGEPRNLHGARPWRRPGRGPAQRPLLGDRRPRPQRHAPDLRRS